MEKGYRPCIVAVVTKDFSSFLVGERQKVPGAWQFPQGGIEAGETPEQAVIRELCEEIGTGDATILGSSKDWITYDFPPELDHPITKKFRGQTQKWFLLNLNGSEPDLALSDGEFRALEWHPMARIVKDVIYWKAESYRKGLKALGLEV